MVTQRYVTATEYNWIMRKREEEDNRRREEEANVAAMNKKGAKKQDKKVTKIDDKKDVPPPIDPNEDVNIPLSDPIPEPEYTMIEKSEKIVILKSNAIADFARFDIDSRQVIFRPTLMYTTRTHSIKLRNTSLIGLKYNCKIVSAETGVIDPGFFYVNPK